MDTSAQSPGPGGHSRSRDEYARLARIYDPLTAPFLDRIRRYTAERVRRAGCERVLDICCGTGRQCLFLHQAGINAVGVDRSAAMIDVARTGTPASVACLRQDAAKLGFADHVFHGAIICLALHEKPEGTRQAIVREAVRVLVPGGLLLLIDFAPPRGAVGRTLRLGLSLVERLVGREHYANFRSYTIQGGLAGMTSGLPLCLIGGEVRFLAGNIQFAVLSASA